MPLEDYSGSLQLQNFKVLLLVKVPEVTDIPVEETAQMGSSRVPSPVTSQARDLEQTINLPAELRSHQSSQEGVTFAVL